MLNKQKTFLSNMKILIAVASCHSMRHYQDSQRSTWVKDIPSGVDFRYFLGRPDTQDAASDEVFLDVGDLYVDCTEKTIAQNRWAVINGYDWMYRADLDTLVIPDRLLNSGFEHHDFVGGQNGFFCSGGSGYWLSRKSMELIASQPVPVPPRADEDVFVAQTLIDSGIKPHFDSRYQFLPGAVMNDQTIAFHLSSVRAWWYKHYEPRMITEAYADYKARNYRSYVEKPPEPRLRRLRRT